MILSRFWAAAVLAVAAIACVAFDLAVWSLLALLALVTVALQPAARSCDVPTRDLLGWLPASAAVGLSALAIVTVVAGALGVPLWGGGRGPLTWSAVAIVAAGGAAIRRGRIALWSPLSLVAWAPAAVLACLEAFRFSHPMTYWSRPVWVLSDWMNHGEMVVDLYQRGALDYGAAVPNSAGEASLYPRGLHAVVAWLIDAGTGATTVPEAWSLTVTAVVSAVAIMTVLIIAGASLLAVAAARRLRAPTWVAVAAAIVTPLLLLDSSVFQVLDVSGYVTTCAAVLLLYGLMLIVDAGPYDSGYAYRLSLVSLLVAGMFNVWQILVVPIGLAWLYLAWRWVRSGHRHAIPVIASTLVALAACLPLSMQTLTSSAVGWSKVGTPFQPFPVVILVLVIGLPVAMLIIRWRTARPLSVVFVTAMAGMIAMVAALVIVASGSFVELPYYAGKVTWNAVVLALPAAVASGGALVAIAWRSESLATATRGSRVAKAALVGGPLLLLAVYVSGWVSVGIGESLRNAARPDGATPQVAMAVLGPGIDLGAPNGPVLVWQLHPQGWQLGRRFQDWHASQLLRTSGYVVPADWVLTQHDSQMACEWLADHPAAARLTGPRLGYRELIANGCPESVVAADRWQVVTTPAQWWVDTPWEATGGAPDPTIVIPDRLMQQ